MAPPLCLHIVAPRARREARGLQTKGDIHFGCEQQESRAESQWTRFGHQVASSMEGRLQQKKTNKKKKNGPVADPIEAGIV